MRLHRTAALAVTALAGLGLAACSSATSTTAATGRSSTATSGGSSPTSRLAIGGASASLCSEVATVTTQQHGLAAAGQASGTAPESVTVLHAYGRTTKLEFDQIAPRITADLATAPQVVRAAWSSLQPQVDQLLVAGASAASVPAFTRDAAVVETSNGFVSASQTLSAFTHGACRTAQPA